MIIRQIAEEFAPNNIKLPSQRKHQLTKNFKEQLPIILNALRGLLEHEISKVTNNRFPDETSKRLSELGLGLEVCLRFLFSRSFFFLFFELNRSFIAISELDSNERSFKSPIPQCAI